MIFGIGTDLIDIGRMDAAYRRHGQRLLVRLLSPAERPVFDLVGDKARWLAKRWAAKEAFAKALGTGIRPPVSLAGITVTHDPAGRPGLAFDSGIMALLAQHHIVCSHLSVSDERANVIAFVVLESNKASEL